MFGAAFSPTGLQLATGAWDCAVRVWDLDSGRLRSELAGHTRNVTCVTWDPSGAFLASGAADDTVRVWDTTSGSLRHKLTGHTRMVNAVEAHPFDDLFASASEDRTVCLWRWSSGECVRVLEGHSSPVYSLAASATLLVSGSGDRSVRVWVWATGECIHSLRVDHPVFDLAWRGDLLSVLLANQVVTLWSTDAPDPAEWTSAGSLSPSGVGVALLDGNRLASVPRSGRAMISVWGP